MKSFISLIVFVVASFATSSAADLIEIPIKGLPSVPPTQTSMPLCEACVAPGCDIAQLNTNVTLTETKSLGGDELSVRTFTTEVDSKGVAKLVAGFTVGASTKKAESDPTGVLTNRLETDVVMAVNVTMSPDASKGDKTMTTTSDTLEVKIPAGTTCSTPLPKGYDVKDVSQVMAFMNTQK